LVVIENSPQIFLLQNGLEFHINLDLACELTYGVKTQELVNISSPPEPRNRVLSMFSVSSADLTSNTAQLLTSLVEAFPETPPSESAPALLKEALDLFDKCLSIQEAQKSQLEAQAAEATKQFEDMAGLEDGGVSVTPQASIDSPSSPSQDGRWATIVEPVTNSTLLDTVLAQLQALTTLFPLIPSDPAAAKDVIILSDQANPIIKGKLEAFTVGTGRELEAAIARGNLLSAFADACFRCSMYKIEDYQKELDNAWTIERIDLNSCPEALCNMAESLITFATSLRADDDYNNYDNPKPKFLSARFKALSTALERLTAASKLPDADNLVKIHLLRGDVEMWRYQASSSFIYLPLDRYLTIPRACLELYYYSFGRKH
jgi:hypothetical protein